uniref:Uncharacterized protein n=1 Tax=Ananas comosus var. bracteatus TaxID=296719 RepID=A0A6V7NHH4_ANACO|nr:unnamed protein product [Ananas comosus var. bracteatus]
MKKKVISHLYRCALSRFCCRSHFSANPTATSSRAPAPLPRLLLLLSSASASAPALAHSAIAEADLAAALDARDAAPHILKALAPARDSPHALIPRRRPLPPATKSLPPASVATPSSSAPGWRKFGNLGIMETSDSKESKWLRSEGAFEMRPKCLPILGECYEHKGSIEAARSTFDPAIWIDACLELAWQDLQRLFGSRGRLPHKKRMREEVASSANQVVDEVGTTNQVRVFEDADEFIGDGHDFHEVGNDSDPLDASTQWVEMQEEDDETYTQCLLSNVMGVDELNDCTSWVRIDVEERTSIKIMARSKRLRLCEITTEDGVQLNGNESSPVSQTQHIIQHDADASLNSDSDSVFENESQVQEQVDHEYNDTLEIEDDQGHTTNKRGMTRAKDVWNLANGQRITKFKLPMDNNVNAWILKSVSRKWKDYKCELKAKYMIEDYTEQQIVNVVPKKIVPQQWVDLVHYWFRKKLYSRIGRTSRAKHTTPHTTGSMSFARKRQEFEEKNQREPGRIEFFAVTHKSKDGSYINTEASNFVSDAMVEVNASITSGSSASATELENDAFIRMKGKDRYGRVRGYGIGVVPTQVFGPQVYIGNVRYDDNIEEVQRLKSKIQLMQDTYESRLVEMQKEYESKLDMIHLNYESRMGGCNLS